jgi:hypothetical protein
VLKYLIEGNPNGIPEDESMLNKRWVKDSWQAMDQISRQGFNLFHLAALYCESKLISYFIQAFRRRERLLSYPDELPPNMKFMELKPLKVMLEAECHGKYTPLLLSIKQSRVEVAKFLTEQGCNWYCHNERLQNVLHLASLHGCHELIVFYTRLDSDFNTLRDERDIKQRRPKDLDMSGKYSEYFCHIWDHAREGNEIKLRELIARGHYDVNAATPQLRLTPLHLAIEHKQLLIIRTLMELKADANFLNVKGFSPADLALTYKDSSVEAVVLKLLRGDRSFTGQKYSETDLNSFVRQAQRKKLFTSHLPTTEDNLSAIKLKKRAQFNSEMARLFELIKRSLKERNVSLDELVSMINKKRNEPLSYTEFEGILMWLGVNLDSKLLKGMCSLLDPNNSGEISVKLVKQQTKEPVAEQPVKAIVMKTLQAKLMRTIQTSAGLRRD